MDLSDEGKTEGIVLSKGRREGTYKQQGASKDTSEGTHLEGG